MQKNAESNAEKNYPRSAVKTLWSFGVLKCSGRPIKHASYQETKEFSKNGLYAVLALDILLINPKLSQEQVWSELGQLFSKIFPEEYFPSGDEGASEVAYKLYHLGQVWD